MRWWLKMKLSTKIIYFPSDYCPCGAGIFTDAVAVLEAGEYRTGTGAWTVYQCLECKRVFRVYWPKAGTLFRKADMILRSIKGKKASR
jgi:hypothetical protein